MSDDEIDPRLVGGLDLLRRTGASSFQIRYADDEEPTVWFAVVLYEDGARWDTASAAGPVEAVMRLCGQVIDGGKCVHCERPTMFSRSAGETWPSMVESMMCLYQWDPELKTFRRACEGDRP